MITKCLNYSIEQILYHALRINLQHRLRCDKDKYQKRNAFEDRDMTHGRCYQLDTTDFGTDDAYQGLLEAAPPFASSTTSRGWLSPEHIFCFANILRRPILLLCASSEQAPPAELQRDSFCLFLPLLHDLDSPEILCSSRKLLVIAWQNRARNHYVPVVPVKGARILVHHSLIPADADGLPVVYGLSQGLEDGLPQPAAGEAKARWIRHYSVDRSSGGAFSVDRSSGGAFFEVGGEGGAEAERMWWRLHRDVERGFGDLWARDHGGARLSTALVNRFCRPLLAAGGRRLSVHPSAPWAVAHVLREQLGAAVPVKSVAAYRPSVEELVGGGGADAQAQLLEMVTALVKQREKVRALRERLGQRRVFDLWGDSWVMYFEGEDSGHFYHSRTLTEQEARAAVQICRACDPATVATTPRRGICGMEAAGPHCGAARLLFHNMTEQEVRSVILERRLLAIFQPPAPAAAAGSRKRPHSPEGGGGAEAAERAAGGADSEGLDWRSEASVGGGGERDPTAPEAAEVCAAAAPPVHRRSGRRLRRPAARRGSAVPRRRRRRSRS